MTGKAWMQSITGRAVELARPDATQFDILTDLPEDLAQVLRFNGATWSGAYSVAQHCVIIADAILDETGDAEAAALGLLHDAPEFVIGDKTTPVQMAEVEVERELFGDRQDRAAAVRAALHDRWDAVIHRACGVVWPPSDHHRRIVKLYDARALITERNQLMAPPVKSWGKAVESVEPLRIRGRLQPWPPFKAAAEFKKRMIHLCPAVAEMATARGL